MGYHHAVHADGRARKRFRAGCMAIEAGIQGRKGIMDAMLYYVAVGILLLWNSVQDIRKKTLYNRGLLLGAGVMLLLFAGDCLYSGTIADLLLSEGEVPWKRLLGVIPGIGVLILSIVLRGGIGKGDGYLLCITGMALGAEQNTALLLYGLFLAGVMAAVLLILKRVKRDTKLPFVPFLFAGFLLTVVQQFA